MKPAVKEIHPVDNAKASDGKVVDDITEAKLITEDEIKEFRQTFSSMVSARALGRENDYQAQKAYKSYLAYIQEEIRKFGNPVIMGLFELQTDIYKAIHMRPPGQN